MTVEAPEERLQVQHCGGRDLISNCLLISQDGKLIFVNGEKKVTVFNAETGQPIRELNTGSAVGLGLNKGMLNFLFINKNKLNTIQLSKVGF